MLIGLIEIGSPVAVIAGFAAIFKHTAITDRFIASKALIGIIQHRRNPDGTKTHVLYVIDVLQDTLEISAHVTSVSKFAVRPFKAQGPTRMIATLLFKIVAGVTINKTVCHHKVHRFFCKRFLRAVYMSNRRIHG